MPQMFRAEQQALAMMNHENIARVFDAGITEHGRPYFVMEYVDGINIKEYAACPSEGDHPCSVYRLKKFIKTLTQK